MSSLIGKTGSGTYESEKDAYDFNNNIIEQQKQQLNQVKTELAKTKREIIASMIPRNLPQYRSDEDFEKELEYRVLCCIIHKNRYKTTTLAILKNGPNTNYSLLTEGFKFS
jgi:hypothetical protein